MTTMTVTYEVTDGTGVRRLTTEDPAYAARLVDELSRSGVRAEVHSQRTMVIDLGGYVE